MRQWFSANLRFRVHFTPTSASWLDLVERWFALISSQAIRRGSFDSVRSFERAINRYLAHWNGTAKPFRWTRSARQIRKQTNGGALLVAAGERAVVDRVVFQSNTAANRGGAIAVDGASGVTTRVEVRQCTFSDNLAQGPAGGGGIEVLDGELFVADSTLYGNHADYDGAGIMAQRSVVEIERTTLSGNIAARNGGGIWVGAGSTQGSLRLVDSTITLSRSDSDRIGGGTGGGLLFGGGVTAVELRMVNNVVARNLNGGAALRSDLSMSPASAGLLTTGWNLVGDNTGGGTIFPAGNPNAQGNFVGTVLAPIDPRLEVLGDNGGPTLTHRPLLEAASPVIDHGSCPTAVADQHGWGSGPGAGRISDHSIVDPNPIMSDGCDIGAVERVASPKAASGLFSSDFEAVTLLFWSAAKP